MCRSSRHRAQVWAGCARFRPALSKCSARARRCVLSSFTVRRLVRRRVSRHLGRNRDDRVFVAGGHVAQAAIFGALQRRQRTLTHRVAQSITAPLRAEQKELLASEATPMHFATQRTRLMTQVFRSFLRGVLKAVL